MLAGPGTLQRLSENSSLPLSASGGCQPSLAFFGLLILCPPLEYPICTRPSSYKDTYPVGLGPILLQYDVILTNYICNDPIFLFKKNFFSYVIFWLAVLGLCCHEQAFSSFSTGASHCSGFSSSVAQALGHEGWPVGSLPHNIWNLSGPGIKPVFPALEGGFLTTGPLGKFDLISK